MKTNILYSTKEIYLCKHPAYVYIRNIFVLVYYYFIKKNNNNNNIIQRLVFV